MELVGKHKYKKEYSFIHTTHSKQSDVSLSSHFYINNERHELVTNSRPAVSTSPVRRQVISVMQQQVYVTRITIW